MRYFSVNLILFLVCVVVATPVYSENIIYQWLEHNKTFFSDRPHANAKVITLPDTQANYRVKRIVDGDTIVLENDTKVRLLGINTPEMGSRYRTEETGGKRAKQWLNAQLKGQVVRLETDVEPLDKYGRTLAHVFNQAGEHINWQLVQQGFAAVSLYPPNLKYADALMAAEQQAEIAQLGLWGDTDYRVKAVSELNPNNQQGWQRLTGMVQGIRQTRQYIYLAFSDHFNARIHRSNVHLFSTLDAYVGKNVELRGWINKQQGQLSLLIRHPHALRVY